MKLAPTTASLFDLFRPSTANATSNVRIVERHSLDEAWTASLRKASERAGWRHDTVFVAAWLWVQHRWRGAMEVSLAEPIDDRFAPAPAND